MQRSTGRQPLRLLAATRCFTAAAFRARPGIRGPCCAQGGMIGITQPRRVAAVSVARRVAQEMGVALGAEARTASCLGLYALREAAPCCPMSKDPVTAYAACTCLGLGSTGMQA